MKKKRRNYRVTNKDGTESKLERTFQSLWLARYPNARPMTQVKFHPVRNWKFDFAWPMQKVAVEVQGMGPGHCSLTGMTKDYDKMRAAQLLNWKIVYLTTTHLSPGNIDGVCNDIATLLHLKIQTHKTYVPLSKRK